MQTCQVTGSRAERVRAGSCFKDSRMHVDTMPDYRASVG
jgi:hypothetical protein